MMRPAPPLRLGRRRGAGLCIGLLTVLLSACTELPMSEEGKTDLDFRVTVHDPLLVHDTVLITVEARDPAGRWVISPPVQWNLAPPGYGARVTVVRSTADSLWVRVDDPGTLGIEVSLPPHLPYFRGATVLEEAEARYGPMEVRWDGVGTDTLLTARGPFAVPVSAQDHRDRAPRHGHFSFEVRRGLIRTGISGAGPGIPMMADYAGVDTLIVSHSACSEPCADTLVVRIEPVPVVLMFPPEGIRATSIGQNISLYAYVLDAQGFVIDPADLEWRLVNPADSVVVALVDPAGTAVARTNGEALFAVTHAGMEALGNVGVHQEVSGFALSGVRPLVSGIGERKTVRVDAWDGHGHPIEVTLARGVTWSSGNTQVAVIAEAGLSESVVETVGFGETQIMVQLQVCYTWDGGGCVLDQRVRNMRVIPEPDSVRIVSEWDTTMQGLGPTSAHFFGNIFLPGETIPWAFIEWTSLNPAVATVEETGRVIAHSPGTADLVGRMGSAADTIRVTIIP